MGTLLLILPILVLIVASLTNNNYAWAFLVGFYLNVVVGMFCEYRKHDSDED